MDHIEIIDNASEDTYFYYIDEELIDTILNDINQIIEEFSNPEKTR